MIINDLFLRILALVPSPNCDTCGDEYDAIVWRDSRAKPTTADLLAVSAASLAKPGKAVELKSTVSSAIVGGISLTVLGDPHHYPTTAIDQQNLNGLVTESLLPGSGDEYKFWCCDGAGVWARRSHTKVQIHAVGLAVANHVKQQQARYEQLLIDLNLASTVDQVDAIVW